MWPPASPVRTWESPRGGGCPRGPARLWCVVKGMCVRHPPPYDVRAPPGSHGRCRWRRFSPCSSFFSFSPASSFCVEAGAGGSLPVPGAWRRPTEESGRCSAGYRPCAESARGPCAGECRARRDQILHSAPSVTGRHRAGAPFRMTARARARRRALLSRCPANGCSDAVSLPRCPHRLIACRRRRIAVCFLAREGGPGAF
jgi:hypothetical protein